MASRKVFEVSVGPPEEPLEFDLRFHFADGKREPETETLHAVPRRNAGIDLVLGTINRLNEAGRVVTDGAGIVRFFQVALIPADRDRFTRLVEDPSRRIDSSVLGEVLNWLIEEYGARPTTPSPPS